MKIYVQNIFSENKGINIQIQKIFLEYDHMLGNLSTIQLQISQWSKKKMEINFVASLPNTLVERKKQMNKQMAIKKYTNLGDLKIAEMYFSQFWRLGNPLGDTGTSQCLSRVCFLQDRAISSLQHHMVEETSQLVWGLFNKEFNFTGRAPLAEPLDLLTFQRPHIQTLHHVGDDFNIGVLGNIQTTAYLLPPQPTKVVYSTFVTTDEPAFTHQCHAEST